jgi:protoheme IX farnesyltransferase
MRRTRDRPIPAGRLGRTPAAVFAVTLAILGCWYLAARVNPPTALLAAATLLSYVGMYTPLKRRSSLATLVGAVPGALPAVGGWVAARGSADVGAWVLGAILFLWQMPHFLALAWIYRRDYARAGFRMLGGDGDGAALFATALLYAAALVPAALAPSVLGLAGLWYLLGALGLSLWLVAATAAARRDATARSAGRVFRITLLYLPVLLVLMILDKVG